MDFRMSQSRRERSLSRFALLIRILRNIGDKKSRGAVGAYQNLPCVLRLLCEERTEPFALGILLQFLKAHLRLFDDSAVGSHAMAQHKIGNPYSYLRSLVTDDLKVILAGNDLTGGVKPGGSTTEGGGGGQTPGGSGEVEA